MQLRPAEYRELIDLLVDVDYDAELTSQERAFTKTLEDAVEAFGKHVSVSEDTLPRLRRLVRDQYAGQ